VRGETSEAQKVVGISIKSIDRAPTLQTDSHDALPFPPPCTLLDAFGVGVSLFAAQYEENERSVVTRDG
jgi:hypothetical protein